MIVLKSPAELARTVRRVAREMRSHQFETISDLNQAAGILEGLADAQATTELSKNILEEPL
jgi:hypothetical protein